MPVNTLQEFIDYAKARPGKLTYAGVGIQTVTSIAAGVLKARARLDMTLVPYKGGVQAVADLLAGHVDMYFGNASEMPAQPPFIERSRSTWRASACTQIRADGRAPVRRYSAIN